MHMSDSPKLSEDVAIDGHDPLTDGGGGKKKMIIIIAALLLVLAGGGAAAYFSGALDGLLGKAVDCTAVTEETDEHYAHCQEVAATAAANAPQAVFLEVPDLIVNLSGNARQQRFLKIGIKIELADQATLTKLEPLMPRVTDHLQTYLRELRIEDLSGSAGIYRLRLELLSRVNAAAPGIPVKDILFQEILIQ